ncbi:MAG: pteridine-dependent deoxygenase [Pseudomonadota bacterium]
MHLSPTTGDEVPLARFQGASGTASEALARSTFRLPLLPVSGAPAEDWFIGGQGAAVQIDREGLRGLSVGAWLLCEATRPVEGDPQTAARQIYTDLLALLDESGHPHVVKFWNYLSDINAGEGDEERYKQFCVGRGEAFDAAWRQDYWPAATGVGSEAGEGLRVTVLASCKPPEIIENPRQVSAFHYPRQYGPKSPGFSRAALVGAPEDRLLFISGTAAIVGHDSLHVASVEAQVDETLRNWTSLFDAVAERGEPRPSLSSESRYRVYLRHPEHLDPVRERLEAAGLPLDQTMFLRADICRRELLFEMDGVLALGT